VVTDDLGAVAARFRDVAPAADACTLRLIDERDEHLVVRRGVVQPPRVSYDRGAMVTVWDGGGVGYAATSDLSATGLHAAGVRARDWARATAALHVLRDVPPPTLPRAGAYQSRVATPWASQSLADKVALLRREDERLGGDARIVDREASLWHTALDTLLVDADGGRVEQRFSYVVPTLSATANAGSATHTRTFGGHAFCRQGGLEVLQDTGFLDAAPRIAAQALELLSAPECPTGVCDMVIAPDQMILQLHESIGHPLELDRILGDERNYAGRSFVTLDMFGRYQYGSPLLNVTFDPSRAEELGSYGFDDEGLPASRADVIREGILLRPLGSRTSQLRAGIEGVANARAAGWNRPPIDRMANLNLEAGDHSFAQLVGAVERGVYVESNCSWSIDDSRNKFQFGCEWGRRIVDGELREVVKNPNYRGVSATFWRSLAGVGSLDTVQVLGTPYCGKGEPNQIIRVGHAAPACLFRGVEVFGGAGG
jgi:predicted Zn-dependent protease